MKLIHDKTKNFKAPERKTNKSCWDSKSIINIVVKQIELRQLIVRKLCIKMDIVITYNTYTNTHIHTHTQIDQ